MAFVWNTIGAVTLVSASISLALALVVLLSRPDRIQNRTLGAVLGLEGLAMAGGSGIMYLTVAPDIAFAAQLMAFASAAALVFVYPLFLGTLATPWAAPLRWRWLRKSFLVGAVALPAMLVVRPALFVTGLYPARYAAWESLHGPLTDLVIFPANLFASFLGLVLAVALWLGAAPGTERRRQGASYAAAFGIRDAGWVFFLAVMTFVTVPAVRTFAIYSIMVTSLAYLLVLAYAILKVQLFDIDLKIKWTISRGTVAAVFVATFFVVSELVSGLLSQQVGLVAGVLMTGGLVFVIAPLQRFAERVSDATMPHVRDTTEYRTVRKREVYRAAIESALEDGAVTDRERSMLATLADQLGLSSKEALELERAVAVPAAEVV